MVGNFARHHLNALHVMAFLVRRGVPPAWARTIARGWERVSHRWLYPGRGGRRSV